MSTCNISVIIPVFNQWEFTAQCLTSLAEHTPENIEVIVVDNASSDKTATDLDLLGKQLWGDNFMSVRLGENKGFACACNLGASLARSDTLLFLNNDTLLTPNWLPPLLKELRDNDNLAAVGPKLLYPGNKLVQHIGVTFLPANQADHLYEYFPADHPVVTKKRDLLAITAAAMCIPARLFKQMRGFYEGYVNGFEDLDLCFRLKSKGYKFRCVPQSTVLHFKSQTMGRFEYEASNNSLLLERIGGKLEPDIHILAENDGLEMRLNEWLVVTIALPKNLEEELNCQAASGTIQNWYDMLTNEPLWEKGYELVARELEKKQHWQDALYLRSTHAHFFPSQRNYLNLLKASQKAKAFEITKTTADTLKKITRDAPGLRSKAQSRIDWAKSCQNKYWEDKYRLWLKHYNTSSA